MVANKDRLYIGLYVRGGVPQMTDKEDTYVEFNKTTWVKQVMGTTTMALFTKGNFVM